MYVQNVFLYQYQKTVSLLKIWPTNGGEYVRLKLVFGMTHI